MCDVSPVLRSRDNTLIAEMNEDGFIALMKLYQSRQLDNPTMQTVAMRLSDVDIAALAANFSALKPPD
jgi:cytochrome c553